MGHKHRNCNKNIKGHPDWIKCLVVLTNGLLVSGSNDGLIKICWNWDTNTGNEIRTLDGHKRIVNCLVV